MQLQSARLCLDCDEVHEAQRCPQCASETFAFITRWVPVPDRPQPKRPLPQVAPSPEALGAYRGILSPDQNSGGKWKTIRRGAVGLALFGIAGWVWGRNKRPGDESDQTRDDGMGQHRP